MAEPDLAAGKAALILGAGSGVGRACAVALAGAGADVAVASLSLEGRTVVRVHSVANEIWSLGRRNLALELDAGDMESVRGIVARVVAEFGRLDVAVIVSTDEALAAAVREAGAPRVIAVDPEDPRAESEIVSEVLAAAG